MRYSLIVLGFISIIIITLLYIIFYKESDYTIDDHHNDITKDYDEEKWIKYQETEEFKKSNNDRK